MAPTAGLLVTRADWERIGGLPEDDIHGDTLFSWSLVAAGVRLTLVRDAVFEHDHGTSVRELVRERYARGRDFAPLRRLQRPSAASRLEDVAATATLVRPARVTARSVAAAARSEGTAEALATLPVVAAGQLAWFAGELAGLLGR